MPAPSFYDPQRVGQVFRPEVAQAIQEGAALGLSPAETDEHKILLLLIDAQIDFIHPDGALSVPGAVADTRRVIDWLHDHLEQVTTIAASLDSHIPIQIFYPTWWISEGGDHPEAYTVITSEDVHAGRWMPVYEPAWSAHYVEALENQAKKELMIWPYHTMIGSQGHNLMPALYESILYHAAARQSQPIMVIKGSIPKTEHYSILEPEVKVPENPQGTINLEFLQTLETYEKVYIAGQAKSHCVLETVASLMNYYVDRPDMVDRLRLLIDCTSSVVHPEIDFEALANEVYAQFEQQGLHRVRAADGIG